MPEPVTWFSYGEKASTFEPACSSTVLVESIPRPGLYPHCTRARVMGCCASSEDAVPSRPMSGDQVIGKEQGVAITRDEQRARAAAAAEARAASSHTLTPTKVKPPASRPDDGRVDVSDPRAWE